MITALALIALLFQGSTARSVELWSEHPIVVTVEWLTIDAKGTTVVHDRRDIAIDGRAPMAYASGPERYVRFSYSGVSPHTYASSELALYKSMRVPDVLPGGELLLLVPGATVRPAALEFHGPRVVTRATADAIHTRLAGVPAGAYQVTPVYEGGLRGATRAVSVGNAASTVALLPIEGVGAIDLAVDRAVCDAATAMSLEFLVKPSHETDEEAPPKRAPLLRGVEPRCLGLIAGLPPGRLEVSYSGRAGGLGRAIVDVEPQTITPVPVASSSISVRGRVTLNGKPVANETIGFIAADGSIPGVSRPAETVTDAAGYYDVRLGYPGRYRVSMLSAKGVVLGGPAATFTEDVNAYDVALTGGTILVEVTGWDLKGALVVSIEGGGRMVSLGWQAAGPMSRSFSGLPYGEYTVKVAGTRIAQRVTISAARPEASVTLDLSQR